MKKLRKIMKALGKRIRGGEVMSEEEVVELFKSEGIDEGFTRKLIKQEKANAKRRFK